MRDGGRDGGAGRRIEYNRRLRRVRPPDPPRSGAPDGARGWNVASLAAKIPDIVVFQGVAPKKQGKSRAKRGQTQGESRREAGRIRPPKPPAGALRRLDAADRAGAADGAAPAGGAAAGMQSSIAASQLMRCSGSGGENPASDPPRGSGRIRRLWGDDNTGIPICQAENSVERKIRPAVGVSASSRWPSWGRRRTPPSSFPRKRESRAGKDGSLGVRLEPTSRALRPHGSRNRDTNMDSRFRGNDGRGGVSTSSRWPSWGRRRTPPRHSPAFAGGRLRAPRDFARLFG